MIRKNPTKFKPGRRKAEIEAGAEKPRAVPLNLDGVPVVLRMRPQWVCWRYEWRVDKKGGGKWTKVPIDPKTGNRAKANEPSTWGTFDQAVKYYSAHSGEIAGVGYEFHPDDPVCGVDLDDAIDPETGELKSWAVVIVKDFATFTEISPSETGLKLYLLGKKSVENCRKKYQDGEIEIYDHGRFFAITGARWPNTPATVEPRQAALDRLCSEVFGAPEPSLGNVRDEGTVSAPRGGRDAAALGPNAPPPLSDDEVLDRANRAGNAPKFRSLMRGDVGGHDGDESRADESLLTILAFYTFDPAQLERLFGQSDLAKRDKWTERADYRSSSVAKAIAYVKAKGAWYTPTSRGASHKTNGQVQAAGAAKGPAAFPLDPFTIQPGAARRTASGAVKVQIAAFRGGVVVYDCVLSASPAAWRQHAAVLEQLAGDAAALDRAALMKAFAEIVADRWAALREAARLRGARKGGDT